jgi:spermidine synthase
MNSRVYTTEEALSRLGCARIADRPKARVLIRGLGMGYALPTALAHARGVGREA